MRLSLLVKTYVGIFVGSLRHYWSTKISTLHTKASAPKLAKVSTVWCPQYLT